MDGTFKELIEFKYQSNLIYAEGVLEKELIDFKRDDKGSNKLHIKPQDKEKVLAIINKLNLDETEVDEASDGYLEGYNEWADKRFVSGYFTGGKIPLWMYDKTYAKFYGPFLIVSGLLAFIVPFPIVGNEIDSLNPSFDFGAFIVFVIYAFYMVCGVLLTIQGFRK